jgi:hypothetical protein
MKEPNKLIIAYKAIKAMICTISITLNIVVGSMLYLHYDGFISINIANAGVNVSASTSEPAPLEAEPEDNTIKVRVIKPLKY